MTKPTLAEDEKFWRSFKRRSPRDVGAMAVLYNVFRAGQPTLTAAELAQLLKAHCRNWTVEERVEALLDVADRIFGGLMDLVEEEAEEEEPRAFAGYDVVADLRLIQALRAVAEAEALTQGPPKHFIPGRMSRFSWR